MARNTPRTEEEIKKFIDESSVSEPNTGCILWTGGADKDGYGKLRAFGIDWRAHRLVYHFFKNKISPNDIVCHKCDTPACINPDHLFLGSPLLNMQDKASKGRLRNQNIGKTHCKNGHEFTSENTRLDETTKGSPKRICITCYTKNYKDRNAKRKTKDGFHGSRLNTLRI